jgi:hypothetical protein
MSMSLCYNTQEDKGKDMKSYSIPLGRRCKQIELKLDKLSISDSKWESLYQEQCTIQKILADRNLKGKQLEKEGNLDAAIKLYEQNIYDEDEGQHPYTRLAIIYRKQARIDEEIRILMKTIQIFGHSEKWDRQLINAQKR